MVKRVRTSRRMKRMKGGNSAWQYVMDTVGSGQQQAVGALEMEKNTNLANANSNAIKPINGLHNQRFLSPNLNSTMKGGRKQQNKGKRGGMWGAIAQAIPSLSLFGLQQSVRFKPKNNKYQTYRRH